MSVQQKRAAGLVATATLFAAFGFGVVHWGDRVVGEEPRVSNVATSSATPADREKAAKGATFAKELSHAFPVLFCIYGLRCCDYRVRYGFFDGPGEAVERPHL